MTAADRGRRLLAASRVRVKALPVNGTMPRKGFWIVDVARRTIRGQILWVRRNGTIVYEGSFGSLVDTSSRSLEACELRERAPRGASWRWPNAPTWKPDRYEKARGSLNVFG